MTFSVKQYMADKRFEPFPFEDINGDTKYLPNLMTMTAGQANDVMSRMDTDPADALAAIDPDMADTILAIPVVALMPLAEAYLEHCKAGMGEAQASPASSRSTARPSKRTSPATTRARTRKR